MKNIIILIICLTGIALFFYFASTTNADIDKTIGWDYYPDYGSKDASFLRLYHCFISDIDNPKRYYILKDSISVQDSTVNVMCINDHYHYFYMTAIDSSSNESGASNILELDLINPGILKNLRFK